MLIFRTISAALALMLLNSNSYAAPPSIETLLKKCEQKTIVVNREGKRVGEALGGYCAAYLEATLDALRNTPGLTCDVDQERTPDYLLTVLETYIKDTKIDRSSEVSKTLLAAYRRAFSCAVPKGK